MKVWVDPQRCQGHGLCHMIAPESFDLDDVDGHSTAVTADVAADQEELVTEAMQSCPERAIFIDGKNAADEYATGEGQPDWMTQ
ncbi:ferredoxin [Mycolicibacillus parakoreensis]|nr:ferredoxin [Mycolicibacillus parakoreensis]